MLGAILLSVTLGCVTAWGTAFLLGPKKAVKLPGGSLAVGYLTGLRMTDNVEGLILCAIAGLIGWVLYRLAVKV